MISIHSFIHRKLVVLKDNTSAGVVAKAMRDNEIGCVLIMDSNGHLSGIVTDRDFVCRWAAEQWTPDIPISRIMTPEIIKADENSNLNDVISLMETHGIRRIPIVSQEIHTKREQIIGIVTLDDLIVSGAIAPRHLTQIVRRQIGRRIQQLEPFVSRGIRTERRSEAHLHQTLDRFYAYLAQITGTNPDQVPQITQFLLGCLTMRVTATSAAHFIAQLPKLIQPALLRLPPGPDRSTTVEWILSELVSRHHFTEEFARSVFTHFIAGLQNLVDAGAIRTLKSQLPVEFQRYFPTEIAPQVSPSGMLAEMPASSMVLTSSAFSEDGEIPVHFTGEGKNLNPPLQWSTVPTGTKEFALICEDLDPSFETSWIHWVIFGIPPTVTSLPEGMPKNLDLDIPVRARQGKNSWGNVGYQGPMPPVGHPAHRYCFRIYALDHEVNLPSGISRTQLASELRGHILAEGVLSGRYQHSAVKTAA